MFYAGHQTIGGLRDYCWIEPSPSKAFSTGPREDAQFLICLAEVGGSLKITTPADGGTFSTLVILWTQVAEATTYDLWIYDLADPTKRIPGERIPQTTFDYSQKLGGDPTIPGHCYLIRVTAFGTRAGYFAVDSVQACRQ
jgi:hypothetical protein